MEYPVHWAIVFSDVVLRSAQALKQYRLIASTWDENERFEATLTLSVAQTILAATKELHIALERGSLTRRRRWRQISRTCSRELRWRSRRG